MRGPPPVSIDPLTRQRLIGTNVLTSLSLRADNRTWTADADLTPGALGRLREGGVEQLVVPEASLAPLDTRAFPDSPTEPFKVLTDTGIPTPAWQIDDRLQAAFTRTADPVLGANQLLAELALTSFELNGAQGGVVLSPPDDWRPSLTFLGSCSTGWAEQSRRHDHDRGSALRPVPPAGSNGAASYGPAIGASTSSERSADPSRPSGLPTAAATRTSCWRATGPWSGRGASGCDPSSTISTCPGRRPVVQPRLGLFPLITNRLNRQFTRVTTPRREKVTLTARDADFPLTLQSRLGYPVNVVVDLQASNRLSFPDGNRIQKRLVGERTRVKLRVRAPVSGDTPLQVTVRSPDGNVVLAQSSYTVRSTAVSGVGRRADRRCGPVPGDLVGPPLAQLGPCPT